MKEKDLEDIICKYPELIETDLVFIGRQMRLHGKIIDVLFEDKFKQKLIVELKIGPVDRKHIGQVMEYEGNVLSEEDPTARIMLVGNRVPPNFRKALDHHGIEWKEINAKQLCGFVKEKNDPEFLHLFADQAEVFTEHRQPKMAEKRPSKTVAGIDEVSDIRRAVLHRTQRERGIPSSCGPAVTESQDPAEVVIPVTEACLVYNLLYLSGAIKMNFFPREVIGGSNSAHAGREVFVRPEKGREFYSDIAGDKKIFRNRSGVACFFREAGVQAGDCVLLKKLSAYEYVMRRKT